MIKEGITKVPVTIIRHDGSFEDRNSLIQSMTLCGFSHDQEDDFITIQTPSGGRKILMPNDYGVIYPSGRVEIYTPEEFKKQGVQILNYKQM